jgi:hypothetical protein
MPYQQQQHGSGHGRGNSGTNSGQSSQYPPQAPGWASAQPAGYAHSRSELWFIYNFPDVTLSANASASPTIQILSDADFIATWINYHSTGTFTVQILEGASGKAFSNNPVNAADFMGNGQNPSPLLPPYWFPKNQQVIFNLTDTSGSSNKIGISLVGRKIFGSQ